MKQKLIAITFFLATWSAAGQGTLFFDQNSTNSIEGASFLGGQPMGQSFSPSLSSIGFVQLNLFDSDALNHFGARVSLNLRSGSIAGAIIGSSAPLFLPDGFFGTTNFLFSAPIPVTPNVTYYIQPFIQSGDAVSSYVTDGSYAGGTAIYQGVPVLDRDLWFREGIVVPEPGTSALLVIGCGLLAWRRRLFA